MRTKNIQTGRHRLGNSGTVHCLLLPAVATALTGHRRSWLSAFTSRARHRFVPQRLRTALPVARRWVPAAA